MTHIAVHICGRLDFLFYQRAIVYIAPDKNTPIFLCCPQINGVYYRLYGWLLRHNYNVLRGPSTGIDGKCDNEISDMKVIADADVLVSSTRTRPVKAFTSGNSTHMLILNRDLINAMMTSPKGGWRKKEMIGVIEKDYTHIL